MTDPIEFLRSLMEAARLRKQVHPDGFLISELCELDGSVPGGQHSRTVSAAVAEAIKAGHAQMVRVRRRDVWGVYRTFNGVRFLLPESNNGKTAKAAKARIGEDSGPAVDNRAGRKAARRPRR